MDHYIMQGIIHHHIFCQHKLATSGATRRDEECSSMVVMSSSVLKLCAPVLYRSNPSFFFGLSLSRGSRSSFASACVSDESIRREERTRKRRYQFLLGMEQFTSGSLDANKALVECLRQSNMIKSDEVEETMQTIDRAFFVPVQYPPYLDSPMPIGYNATISAPHMHATCLELLKDHLQPGMRALDVGSGSGYLTTCFAMMVGPEGRAVGIEHIPELVADSIENVKRSAAKPLLESGSLSLHVADGRHGWKEEAPYDAIHVGAAATEIPKDLIEQLKPGGRMVIPVGNIFQDLQVLDKKLDGSVSSTNETSVRYVPLTSRPAQLQGY